MYRILHILQVKVTKYYEKEGGGRCIFFLEQGYLLGLMWYAYTFMIFLVMYMASHQTG